MVKPELNNQKEQIQTVLKYLVKEQRVLVREVQRGQHDAWTRLWRLQTVFNPMLYAWWFYGYGSIEDFCETDLVVTSYIQFKRDVFRKLVVLRKTLTFKDFETVLDLSLFSTITSVIEQLINDSSVF